MGKRKEERRGSGGGKKQSKVGEGRNSWWRI